MQAEPEPNDPTHCQQQVLAEELARKLDKSLQLLDSLCMGKLLLRLQKTAPPPPRRTQLKPLQQKISSAINIHQTLGEHLFAA